MGKSALKARMPRVLPNHRCTYGFRLRKAFVEILAGCKEPGGVARRVALMGAESWLAYEDLGIEIAQAPRKKMSALEVSRLRRRRQIAAGHFLGALRTLEFLLNGNGDGKFDLASELVKQGSPHDHS
jgi:hypothetical protein